MDGCLLACWNNEEVVSLSIQILYSREGEEKKHERRLCLAYFYIFTYIMQSWLVQ
jgi:hypothetical protein